MSDTLADTAASYRAGTLAKPAYIEAMFAGHARLFEYPALLHGDIRGLEITADGVVAVSRAGVRFRLDPHDERQPAVEALNFGTFEGDDGAMIAALAKPGAVVYDVGANVGWYALHLATTGARVIAFEPVPATLAQLRANLALNELSNVTIVEHGLSNRDEELTFFVYPEGSGGASSANLSGRPSVREVRCRVKRLDDVAPTLPGGPDLMKIDVEGAELFVLQGAVETLRKYRPAIVCEMLRKWAARFDYHPNDIIDLLTSLGYDCFTALPGRQLAACPRVDDATTATNFVFLHRERHGNERARFLGFSL